MADLSKAPTHRSRAIQQTRSVIIVKQFLCDYIDKRAKLLPIVCLRLKGAKTADPKKFY